MNIISELEKITRKTPNKIALINEESSVTYELLFNQINRTVNTFKQIGIKEGDRILIQIGNRMEFIYCYFAAMKMEAIIVPINPTYTPKEIAFIAENAQPTLFICEQSAQKNIPVISSKSSEFKTYLLLDETDEDKDFHSVLKRHSSTNDSSIMNDDKVCQILYTSGTTGRPKGAMLTHDGLARNAMTYSEILKCTEKDIGLIVAPLYHSASQTNCLLTMLISGATCYIMPKYNTEKVLHTLQAEKITYFFGPPTMYAMLLNNKCISKYEFALRIAFTGAASMPISVHEKWKEIFGFDILEGYGLTECSPIVSNHRYGKKIKHGSVGPPLPGIEINIIDEEGIEVDTGMKGEVTVKGPNVMKGYWRMPKETAEVLRHGWFYTGDIGYKDEDGYLYIVDRKKDMINQGGLKIYPREVEEVLYQDTRFLEVAVVGEPDVIKGELVMAFVTLKNNEKIDFEEVKETCRKELAPYKVPKRFYIIDKMPKTLSGKIQKNMLIGDSSHRDALNR